MFQHLLENLVEDLDIYGSKWDPLYQMLATFQSIPKKSLISDTPLFHSCNM